MQLALLERAGVVHFEEAQVHYSSSARLSYTEINGHTLVFAVSQPIDCSFVKNRPTRRHEQLLVLNAHKKSACASGALNTLMVPVGRVESHHRRLHQCMKLHPGLRGALQTDSMGRRAYCTQMEPRWLADQALLSAWAAPGFDSNWCASYAYLMILSMRWS